MKNRDKQQDTTVVELVDTFKDATGMQFVVEGIRWVSIGSFMGMSDAVPGYSGGTTLAVLGVFKKLILIAKSVFIPEPGITRTKAILFMIPFIVGWLGGIYGFAKMTEAMVSAGFGLELIFFFSFFIMFAIPVFLMAEKPSLCFFRNRKIKLNKTRRWFYFLIGVAIVVIATIFAFLHDGVPFGEGAGFDPGVSRHYSLSEEGWIKLAGFSLIAGMVTIIPGGSGATVQLLSGMYGNVHWKIMAHPVDNVWGLVIFGVSTFIGMLLTTLVMAWGLKKHGKNLAAFSFGMLLTSVIAIYFMPNTDIWEHIKNWEHVLGIVLSVALATSIALYIGHRVRKKQKAEKVKA